MDPSPLLSTTATAAAALVAIVGGFLVSRVISLATERSGLEQRLADLHAQMRAAEERRDELGARALQWEVREVLWEGRAAFATGGGTYDIQAMIDTADVDRDVEEMRPFVEQEAARYQSVRDRLEPLFVKGRPDFTFEEVRESGSLDVATEDQEAYEVVWETLVEEHPRARQPGPFGINFDPSSLLPPDPSWRTVSAIQGTAAGSELASLRRDADEARHRVDALKLQIEQTELAAARVVRPEGAFGGLWVLAYVTVSGTFVPLGLMAGGVESMDWRGAFAVVGLFGSGIGLLMAYVSIQVRRMTS